MISGSPKETNDHGEHHLRFVRAGMDPELRGAFDLLNQELLALSFDLDRRRDAVHYNGERVMALPYRWSGEVAVRAPERGDLWVRIPGPRQPFLFFVGEHESR